jgi:predicted short-subunit dehydrogenase-like oxidoreductase (DUF2520 family)
MHRTRIVGPGRAGTALATALTAAGWPVEPVLDRGDDLATAAHGTDLLVLAVPDGAVAEVAGAIEPDSETVVAHLAGSLTLDVLADHPRRASFHPLVPIPSGPAGAMRLRGATFAVAGDDRVRDVVAALGGAAISVPEEHRVAYHAAAVVASNHIVGLLGQVERIAATADVPVSAYLDLARATIDNVAELGPAAALTGPVVRGDQATIDAHLAALSAAERAGYEAGAELCRTLASQRAEPTDTRS